MSTVDQRPTHSSAPARTRWSCSSYSPPSLFLTPTPHLRRFFSTLSFPYVLPLPSTDVHALSLWYSVTRSPLPYSSLNNVDRRSLPIVASHRQRIHPYHAPRVAIMSPSSSSLPFFFNGFSSIQSTSSLELLSADLLLTLQATPTKSVLCPFFPPSAFSSAHILLSLRYTALYI
ncbi:hypothetical protein BD626DRAFT_531957 [Schizophyllum amplum]|uniref:Uncharacterized protein n=1 Tax=Schizophyllum amplum TaxID=97359 RepID=A0A550BRJ8_9AGAR|nr:hypothetical protein BD626DRAFT_531957 [Auriculariopsis ampla]